jgi:hypothetical protein
VSYFPAPPEQIYYPRLAAGKVGSESVSKAVFIGWITELAGMALWLYGYFATGNPSLINWHAITPWWIADFLPNIESEIGMALVCAGMVPIYWPSRR